jgi:hypothetical protein
MRVFLPSCQPVRSFQVVALVQMNDGHDGLLPGHMLLLEYLLATIRMNRFAHLVGEHDLLGAVGIVLFHLFVRKRNDLEPVRIP